jgi:hypothetical protein
LYYLPFNGVPADCPRARGETQFEEMELLLDWDKCHDYIEPNSTAWGPAKGNPFWTL